MSTYGIGIDIGGSSVKGAIVDQSGNLVYPLNQVIRIETTHTDSEDATRAEILSAVTSILDTLLPYYPTNSPLNIGLGMAGVVTQDGVVITAANAKPDYIGTNWKAELVSYCQKRQIILNHIKIERDVNIITATEWFDVCKHFTTEEIEQFSLLNVVVGTGIGASMVIGGKLLRGKSNSAMEIGQTPIDLHQAQTGNPCATPTRGCYESFAGSKGLIQLARELWHSPHTSETFRMTFQNDIRQLTRHSIWTIGNLADQGDTTAIEIMQRAGEQFGLLLVGLAHTFDPSHLILGGGVVGSSQVYTQVAINFLKEHTIPPCVPSTIKVSRFGSEAGPIGAALLSMGVIRF